VEDEPAVVVVGVSEVAPEKSEETADDAADNPGTVGLPTEVVPSTLGDSSTFGDASTFGAGDSVASLLLLLLGFAWAGGLAAPFAETARALISGDPPS